MIQQTLAIWSLVTLPFLNPAYTSGSSWFTYCWSLAWRILSITLLACEMRQVYRSWNILWDWNENWHFLVLWPLLSFSNLLAYLKYSTLTTSSFRILNSLDGISSFPLALFIVIFPKVLLSGYTWMTTLSWLSGSLRTFLFSSVYSCHLFLISSASVKSLPFLPFIVPILAWNSPLISPTFLKRSLVCSILLFSLFLCNVALRMPSYLSLLFSGTLHSVECLSLSPLPFTSLFSSVIFKTSSDKHFAFVHFFFFRMILIAASFTVLQTSLHSSSGTLSTRYIPLNLFITFTV